MILKHLPISLVKHVLLSVLAFICTIQVQAQAKHNIDSLLIVLDNAEKSGNKATIANISYELGGFYERRSNFNEALKFYTSSLQLNTALENKKGMATVHRSIGLIHKKQGNFVGAVKNYLAALAILEEIKDKAGVATLYSNLGDVYAAQRNFSEALNYYHAYLRTQLETGDQTGLSNAYLDIGSSYVGLQEFTLAMDTLLLAKKICEVIGNKFGLLACLRNIGKIYMLQDNYQPALENYLASLQISRELNNQVEIAITLCDIGKVYILLHQLEEAKTHLTRALNIAKKIGSKRIIRNAYENLTRLEAESGNFQQALQYQRMYIVYKDSLMNEENMYQLAEVKELYESEKKDKEIKLLTIEKSDLERAQQIQALLLKTKQDSLNIAQAEKEKAQLENEKFYALNLSNQQKLELLSNDKRLQELQIEKDKAEFAFQKAEVDKKQEQLIILNKEKEIRELELKKEKMTKSYFIGGIGLFLVLSFFIYRNYQSRQELKMLTLRNKIASDLHDDVGSTLSSISIFSQMAQGQSKEVIPALETIGESSRKMLDAMADIVWTIKPENDEFDKVIMRMRGFAFELLGAKQIDFEFDADDDVSKINLSMEARKNLYLIFKEATNNMVKYSEASRAKFALKGEKDKLKMMIMDNGKGFDPTKEYNGNGLANMKKRAGDMGAQLFINSVSGGGTTISLELAV